MDYRQLLAFHYSEGIKYLCHIYVKLLMSMNSRLWSDFVIFLYSYMVGAFFTRTTLAILFVVIIYLLSYLPYIILVAMDAEMEFWQKILAVSCENMFIITL